MINNLKYFTTEVNEGSSFMKFPKILIEDEKFNKLSIKAKVLYTLLLDRVNISAQNGWKIDGKIYIYYTLDEVARKMKISVRSARTLFKELENGFIETVQQGLGKPNIIFVKSLSSLENKGSKNIGNNTKKYKYAKAHVNAKNVAKEMKKEAQKDREISTLKKRIKELEMQLEMKEKILEKSHENTQEKNTSIECKNCRSRPAKIASQDLQKMPTNKNNINKNNMSIIDSSNQSKKDFLNKNLDSKKNEMNELNYNKIDIKKLTDIVKSDLATTQTIPYEYTTNSVKMELALKELTSYQLNKELSKGDSFYFDALKIFINAATKMLTSERTFTLKGATVTHYKVYIKLIDCIEQNYKGELVLNNIVSNSIRDYEKAVETTDIIHPVNYMCSCIWNALSYDNIKEWDVIKRKN